MPTLKYRGFDSEGRRVSGCKKFSNESFLKDYLNTNQITSYEIFESNTQFKTGLFTLVSPKELAVFCRQMSVLFFSHSTFFIVILTHV